jgi:hypothetical protein
VGGPGTRLVCVHGRGVRGFWSHGPGVRGIPCAQCRSVPSSQRLRWRTARSTSSPGLPSVAAAHPTRSGRRPKSTMVCPSRGDAGVRPLRGRPTRTARRRIEFGCPSDPELIRGSPRIPLSPSPWDLSVRADAAVPI